MDVNERIRALMEERGWTPYRLAKESGLSEGTVGNIFRRNTVPSTATLQAICGGLKITLSQFFAEGEMIELTPELKELFGDWVNLTADQKDAVRHMIPKRQMGCDSQLTVKPRKNSASLVDIILFSSCQMHPTKQEVHPTFRPVHPTCRIVSKWPTFSTKETLNVYQAFSVLFMQTLWCFMHFTAKGRQNAPKSSYKQPYHVPEHRFRGVPALFL